MKKLCLIYANCQGDGVAHFLKKVVGKDYDFAIWHNWQLMMGEQRTEDFMADVTRLRRMGGVAIFQPCKGYPTNTGAEVPATDALFYNDVCPYPITAVSFAYQFNHGFFPFVKLGPGRDGWVTTESFKDRVAATKVPSDYNRRHLRSVLVREYFDDKFHYDCARRFVECLAEQASREIATTIQMAPWILRHYRRHKLFLTYNHPTTVLFQEIAAQILEHLNPGKFMRYDVTNPENEAGMNGVQPVHPAVVKELGLEYPPTDNSVEYYREILDSMMAEL